MLFVKPEENIELWMTAADFYQLFSTSKLFAKKMQSGLIKKHENQHGLFD